MQCKAVYLSVRRVAFAILFAGAMLAVAVTATETSFAQTKPGEASSDEGDTKAQRAERLKQMRERIAKIKAFAGADDAAELPLVQEPILRFSDPARTFSDGTIWAFGDKGRPFALATVERYEAYWSYELISLTEGPVSGTHSDGVRWRPTTPGLVLKPLPDGKPPADDGPARLRQMRDIARQFALVETWRKETYELRLMSNPAHRYADADAGLVDGALFIFAYGTNPEAVLAVECRRSAENAAGWHYGFSRLTAADIVARIGEQIAWVTPPRSRTASDPYMNFQLR